MSDKFDKPSPDPAPQPSRRSWQDTWNPHDKDSLRDYFMQKHEPEKNIPFDRSWQDTKRDQEED